MIIRYKGKEARGIKRLALFVFGLLAFSVAVLLRIISGRWPAWAGPHVKFDKPRGLSAGEGVYTPSRQQQGNVK